jgi:hypothetical protein
MWPGFLRILYLPGMKNLSTSLLHTAWTVDEKLQLDDLIAFVEDYAGGNFILDVCQYLYQLLQIDNILVGYQPRGDHQIQTVYFLHKGNLQPNFTYNFSGAPCSQVLGQDLHYIPFGVQATYPDMDLLKVMEVESYLGMPLFDNQGEGLGLIVLLHQQLIDRGGYVEALLNVIAPRLELEMLFLPTTLANSLPN